MINFSVESSLDAEVLLTEYSPNLFLLVLFLGDSGGEGSRDHAREVRAPCSLLPRRSIDTLSSPANPEGVRTR